jgi:hypothetical protein
MGTGKDAIATITAVIAGASFITLVITGALLVARWISSTPDPVLTTLTVALALFLLFSGLTVYLLRDE